MVPEKMFSLNDDQQNVLSLALKGHNIFINGYAGTGKTYILKKIYNDLRNIGRTVAITCTTGIACMNFDLDMNACTVHRWSGLHDGRYSSAEVVAVVSNNETAMNRINQTDTLIIDEISMLSHKLFDQLHSICSLRDDRKAWGGMQIILSGDFNQLPPTPNNTYNEDGEFCFKSVYFKKIHKLTLNTVVRQSEKEFIDMIRRVSTGINISKDLCNYIKSFERPLQDKNSVKLFSKNDLVNRYNRKLLMSQPGEIYQYNSTDTGDRSKLLNIRAPGTLWIKPSCPVILIRNLSQTLVNGLQGNVVACEPDGPIVHFPKINATLKIKKISFSVFSPNKNLTVANREQIPLLLSYALTIHKSQGMTLDSVQVDCREIFQPGQLGVAIGRVRCREDLQIINFNPKVCFPQPEKVTLFEAEPPLDVCDDLSCCQISQRIDTTLKDDEFWIDDDPVFDIEPQEEFDEQFDQILSQLDLGDSSESVEIPSDFDICKILNDCISESPVTPIQYEVNQMAGNILSGDLYNAKKFCRQQFEQISKIVNDIDITENTAVKAEKLNLFYTACHQYQTSDNYKLACMLFLQNFTPTSNAHSHICTKITNAVRQYLLQEKAQIFKVSERNIFDRKITDASKARIRYVGGYCIHAVRKGYSSKHKSDMYSTSVEGQVNFQIAEERLNILNTFIEREDILKQTTADLQSLIDIERRQYLSHGLLNIKDDVYKFFCEACNVSIQCLIDKNYNLHAEHLHSFCLKEMINNTVLFEYFVHLISANMHQFDEFSTSANLQLLDSIVTSVLNSTLTNVEHANALYKELVEKFLIVMLKQFRKDLLESFSVAKTLAHRKQIQTKKQKQLLSTKCVSFETVLNDKTAKKEMSHNLLKGMIMTNLDVFAQMNKKQIFKLCKAYNVSVKSGEKKAIFVESLKTGILNSDSMPNHRVLISEADPETPVVYQDIQEPSTPGNIPLEADPDTQQPSTSETLSSKASSEISSLRQDNQEQTMSEIISPIIENEGNMGDDQQVQTVEDTASDICQKCQRIGKEGVQMIQCSSCLKWFHRNCAGLRAKHKWLKFCAEGVDFFCNECV